MKFLIKKLAMLLILSYFVFGELNIIKMMSISSNLDYKSDIFRKFEVLINDKYEKRENFYLDSFEIIEEATMDLINEKINKDSPVNKVLIQSKINNKGIIKWMYKIVNRDVYNQCEVVLSELRYFPVALTNKDSKEIYFNNSWGSDRTYGGDRAHEGTDIMTENNISGYYPVISMSNGIVENIGWLELGGYRIGIRTDKGLYLYYAHLDRYAKGITKGSKIAAGQLLGFVGNTGYGEEGTRGKFDTHLHLGIYVNYKEEEVSINPYYVLLQLEKFKIYYHLYK